MLGVNLATMFPKLPEGIVELLPRQLPTRIQRVAKVEAWIPIIGFIPEVDRVRSSFCQSSQVQPHSTRIPWQHTYVPSLGFRVRVPTVLGLSHLSWLAGTTKLYVRCVVAGPNCAFLCTSSTDDPPVCSACITLSGEQVALQLCSALDLAARPPRCRITVSRCQFSASRNTLCTVIDGRVRAKP